jgi:hypothetical protein
MYGSSLDAGKLCSFFYGNASVECKKQQRDNGSKIVYSIRVGRDNRNVGAGHLKFGSAIDQTIPAGFA